MTIFMIVHHLERMANRMTNIYERMIFIETGAIIELDQEDDEEAIEV